MRAKIALPVCLVRGSLTPIVLALLFVVPWSASVADTQKQREKKARHEARKHEVKPHQAVKHTPEKHPTEHPEAHAKQHEAEAKKRRGEDKKRESKAKRNEAKEKQPHPVGLKTRPGQAHRKSAATRDAADSENSKADEATVRQVHAWEESRRKQQPRQANPDSPPATPADSTPADSTKPGGDGAAANGTAGSTGVSNPPPDPQAEVAKPTDVVSVIRRPGGPRPQLEPTEDMAAQPVILQALYTKRGRLVMPPPLKGSHEILLRQNQMADDEGLDRIRDDEDLARMRATGLLVPLPASAKLRVDERLPADRRYCRPWAALFLADMARQFYARFGDAIQVNSAVRTVEVQQRLIHRNGNAAPAEGESASPHLTGQAVDIGKHGLTQAEIAWLRWYLLPLVQAEKVDVEEEFQQACFHISVYKSYLPRPTAPRREVAVVRHGGISALATGLR